MSPNADVPVQRPQAPHAQIPLPRPLDCQPLPLRAHLKAVAWAKINSASDCFRFPDLDGTGMFKPANDKPTISGKAKFSERYR
jgi:hypothetical protein